jgi:hypothetical protein
MNCAHYSIARFNWLREIRNLIANCRARSLSLYPFEDKTVLCAEGGGAIALIPRGRMPPVSFIFGGYLAADARDRGNRLGFGAA